MAISEVGLQNLAKSLDLRIEALNAPTAPGQPQVFQIRPSAMLLSVLGDLIPTEAVLNAAIPVEIAVTWGVETAKGTPLDHREAVTYSDAPEALETTVMVLPDFVELRAGIELPVKTRYVTATVTVAVPAQEIRTNITLVRHPITVPAIPVPTVALFFAKENLGMSGGSLQGDEQFVIVLVPNDSPIASISALRFAFEKLREVSSTAAGLAELAGFGATSTSGPGLKTLIDLGTGLETTIDSFDAHGLIGGRVGMAFVAAESVSNLNDLDTILGEHVWDNDVEAEDTISSMVLLGPPGRRIRCFQNRNFRGRNMSVTASHRCLTIVNALTAPLITDPPNWGAIGSDPLDNRMSSVAFL